MDRRMLGVGIRSSFPAGARAVLPFSERSAQFYARSTTRRVAAENENLLLAVLCRLSKAHQGLSAHFAAWRQKPLEPMVGNRQRQTRKDQEKTMLVKRMIIVLSTPINAGQGCASRGYRVTEITICGDLTNWEAEPEYLKRLLVSLFGNCQVYDDEEEAWRAAIDMADRIHAAGLKLDAVKSIQLGEPFPRGSAAHICREC